MIEGFEPQSQLAPRRGFLRLALGCVFARSTAFPLAALLLLLVASGVLALLYPPSLGAAVPLPYVAAIAIRGLAICYLSAVILRKAVVSERRAWLPDGAFWLFLLPFALSLALPLLAGRALNGLAWLPAHLAADAAAVLLVSPFAAWMVALLADRPPAWRPSQWMRGFRAWLPQRIGWGLLLLVPLGFVHLWLSTLPFVDARWFWPAAIADAFAYFLLLTIRLGLDGAAYWRVAQG
jgi:hypothetical protein